MRRGRKGGDCKNERIADLVQRVDKLKAEVGEERVKKEPEGIIRELLELDMALEIPGQ